MQTHSRPFCSRWMAQYGHHLCSDESQQRMVFVYLAETRKLPGLAMQPLDTAIVCLHMFTRLNTSYRHVGAETTSYHASTCPRGDLWHTSPWLVHLGSSEPADYLFLKCTCTKIERASDALHYCQAAQPHSDTVTASKRFYLCL